MSKLEELIEQYCPDGVEWKTLENVCQKVFAGGTPTSSNSSYYGGDIPWLRSGEVNFNEINSTEKTITEEGYKSSSAKWIEKHSVLIAMTGATVARSAMTMIDLTANQSVCALTPDRSILSYRYLYYWISRSYLQLKGMAQGALTSLNLNIIKALEIPVPPLPVQEEIVRILDTFTELQAELQAELQKRKQQYNFYRDNLLNFKDINRERQEIKWMKIGEICNVITGGEVPVDSIKGDTPQGDFKYPIWGNGKDIYGYSATYQITQDAVCISSIGANTGAVFFHSAYFTPIIRLKVLIPLSKKVSTKYLFYILSTIGFDVKKSSVPNMNSTEVKQKRIPIPPLAEQNRIVAILDRFDTLTNDLTSGLPAEMEKRRQQYEFYRDKLLTFKRKEA